MPLAPTPSTSILGDDAKPVLDVAISPDGTRLALVREGDVLELRDAATGERLRAAQAARPVRPPGYGTAEPVLRFGADGKTLLWGERSVERAWALPSLEPATVAPSPSAPCAVRDAHTVAFRGLDDATATRLASAARRLRMSLRRDGEWTVVLSIPKDEPLHLEEDCRWIWREGSGGVDVVRVSDGAAATFAPWTKGLSGMELPTGGYASVDFGPSLDRFIVYSTSQQGAVYAFSEPRLIDGASMKVVASLHDDCQPNPTLWSPAGRWIIRRDCFSAAMIVHDGRSGRLVRTDEMLQPRSFTRDEQTLAARAGDDAVVLDVATGRRALVIRGGDTGAQWTHFTPDGSALLTRRGGRITRWDLRLGTHAAIETHWEPTSQDLVDPTTAFAWQIRFTGGSDIVDLGTMARSHVDGRVLQVASDGIIVMIEGKRVRVSGADRKPLGSFALERGVTPNAVAVSAGGRWAAASRSDDGRVELFEIATQKRVATFATPSSKRPGSRYDGSD